MQFAYCGDVTLFCDREPRKKPVVNQWAVTALEVIGELWG